MLLACGWIVDQDSSVDMDSGILSPVETHLTSWHVNHVENMVLKSEIEKRRDKGHLRTSSHSATAPVLPARILSCDERLTNAESKSTAYQLQPREAAQENPSVDEPLLLKDLCQAPIYLSLCSEV